MFQLSCPHHQNENFLCHSCHMRRRHCAVQSPICKLTQPHLCITQGHFYNTSAYYLPTLNQKGDASEHELLHFGSSLDELVQQQHQKQGEEDEREIVLVFLWKMGTREQQFPGVGELSASRAAPAVVSICCGKQSYNSHSSNQLFQFKNEILCS